MLKRTFTDLVQDLKQRREVADPPPIVLLGAGASVESGIGAMTDLFQFVNCSNFKQFCDYIQGRTAPERYRLLSRFLQSRQPSEVTPGYRALASLCADVYFDIILTTNLDPLLDDALAYARLWRKDYLLLVNGVIRSDWLRVLVTAQSPRVKVIKLHGDLFQRCMAWTPIEMDSFLTDAAPQLLPVLGARDVLVVGHSLRDARIRELVLGTSGAIWYTTPKAVPDFLSKNDRVRAVVGPECTFERLFTDLAQALGLERPTDSVRPGPVEPDQSMVVSKRAETMDDFMASVIAVAAADGRPVCTGFVLAQPRLIVTDGYVGNTQHFLRQKQVTIVDSNNRRYTTKVIQRSQSHPFGPLVLEAPKDCNVLGLRLDARPLEPNLPVRIGVAVGERVGVSSGRIADPIEQCLPIAPIGSVDHLVAVESVVAPGASGAPVIDASMAVRGFIVAGSTDRPPSFMYPAYRWVEALEAKLRGRVTTQAGEKRESGARKRKQQISRTSSSAKRRTGK